MCVRAEGLQVSICVMRSSRRSKDVSIVIALYLPAALSFYSSHLRLAAQELVHGCEEAIRAVSDCTAPAAAAKEHALVALMHTCYALCFSRDEANHRAGNINRLRAIAEYVCLLGSMALFPYGAPVLPEIVELLAAVYERRTLHKVLLEGLAIGCPPDYPPGSGCGTKPGTRAGFRRITSRGPASSRQCREAEWLQVQLVSFIEHLARWVMRFEWTPSSPVSKSCSQLRNSEGPAPDSAAAPPAPSDTSALHQAIVRSCRLLLVVVEDHGSCGLLVPGPVLGSAAGAATALVNVLHQSAARAFRDVDDAQAQRSHQLALSSMEAFAPVATAAAEASMSLDQSLGDVNDLLDSAAQAIVCCYSDWPNEGATRCLPAINSLPHTYELA